QVGGDVGGAPTAGNRTSGDGRLPAQIPRIVGCQDRHRGVDDRQVVRPQGCDASVVQRERGTVQQGSELLDTDSEKLSQRPWAPTWMDMVVLVHNTREIGGDQMTPTR